MEDALAAVRRIFAEENVGKATLASAEPRTPGEGTDARPDAELLSAEATVAIGSAINTLRETVKKKEPTVEEVVCEALRPVLKSWVDENLPDLVERLVRGEIERAIRGR
jgi:uncharacterized protein